jgi:hypothetical protein
LTKWSRALNFINDCYISYFIIVHFAIHYHVQARQRKAHAVLSGDGNFPETFPMMSAHRFLLAYFSPYYPGFGYFYRIIYVFYRIIYVSGKFPGIFITSVKDDTALLRKHGKFGYPPNLNPLSDCNENFQN